MQQEKPGIKRLSQEGGGLFKCLCEKKFDHFAKVQKTFDQSESSCVTNL